MTNVWYVGPYGKRQLSVSDWAQLGAVATEATEWNLDNGWSIPESQLTPTQLARLAASDEFLTGVLKRTKINGYNAYCTVEPISEVY